MLLHNYGCLLWEGRGEYSRAEGMLEKALKIDPQHGATVQALDDLKADKLDARRRADEIAAELLAQVEVRGPLERSCECTPSALATKQQIGSSDATCVALSVSSGTRGILPAPGSIAEVGQ